MIKKIINTKDNKKAEVIIMEAAYEKTASSHKGTSKGPKKVVEMLNTQIEFFSRKFKKEVSDYIKIGHINLGNLDNFSPEKTKNFIKDNCQNFKDKFIFLIGGEHAVSIGYLESLSKKYKSKDITILQIDAHCDLRNDDSDYSENPSSLAHSTVMRRASEMGYPIVQVGIRTYSKDEYTYFSNPKNNVTVFEWGNGKIPSIEKIIKSIKTKYLYISIDVDGFDPSFMPGTGTPVQGGLEWWYGIELIEKAISKKELVGADIVEISPVSDSVLTEYGAAELCYRILTEKFKENFS